MRTRIDVTFTAGTRSIDTGITDLTIEDIRLIVNETQKKVLCSSMQKDLITSVTNGVVTYVSTNPALAQGDKITFEIDKGDDYPSAVGVLSEIASGKQAIASAINAKGGTASATESFSELAEAVEAIPNYSDMVKLAGIIAGGNYNKNAQQGHNENVKYGKTEIVDNFGAFKKLSYSCMFQYWDLLEKVILPNVTAVIGTYTFNGCSALREIEMPSFAGVASNGRELSGMDNLENLILGKITGPFFTSTLGSSGSNLRNITIGQDTNVNLEFSGWGASKVIIEGQSGIDELNSNLYNNLLTKLYDHSNDGQTRTLRIGWLARVTAENIAYANAKGWTLTT